MLLKIWLASTLLYLVWIETFEYLLVEHSVHLVSCCGKPGSQIVVAYTGKWSSFRLAADTGSTCCKVSTIQGLL